MKRYKHHKRVYEHTTTNEFIDTTTNEKIDIFHPYYQILSLKASVGFTVDTPLNLRRELYHQMSKIKSFKKKPEKKPEKEKPKWIIQGNFVIFDRRTRISIPKGKTAEYIINKYKDKIYGG